MNILFKFFMDFSWLNNFKNLFFKNRTPVNIDKKRRRIKEGKEKWEGKVENRKNYEDRIKENTKGSSHDIFFTR